jgi:hypothetical protein
MNWVVAQQFPSRIVSRSCLRVREKGARVGARS